MLLFAYNSLSPSSLPPCPQVYFYITALKINSSVPSFQIPIYMHQCMIFVFLFLTYFTLYNRLQVELTQMHSFLWLNSIPLYICTTASLTIYQRTSRLLPCSSYCKKCCSEYWGICVFFNFDFLRVYVQEWDCWVIWWFIPSFLRSLHTIFHSGCSVYIPTSNARVFPFLHTLSSIYCLQTF